MYKNEHSINTYLHRIANILLINGGFLTNLGLYTGDMGIVLFFCRYARLTQNDIYLEYSSYLFEKVKNNIQPNTPLNYKQGLTGIGSAIEYLAQHEYLKIDTDVILEEFDKRIFFTFNLSYLSIEKIADIGYYALWRIAGNSSLKSTIINSVIPQIVNTMTEWETRQNMTHPMVSLIKDIISSKNRIAQYYRSIILDWHQFCQEYYLDNLDAKPYMQLLEQFTNNDSTMNNNFELGFQNGLVGLGLSLMSELDGDNSWHSLFTNDLIPPEK